MSTKEKILIVDNRKEVRESLSSLLNGKGYDVDTAENGESALKKFAGIRFDLLLIDLNMPSMKGFELLSRIKSIENDSVVILTTEYASVPTAISALKNGADCYLTKPINPEELAHLVQKAIEQKALRIENKLLKENIDEIIKPDSLICDSYQLRKIYKSIHKLALNDTIVMIRGESGTGKDLVAKAIHINSKRKYFPFVQVSCGALRESLLECELFGQEKGSSVGAQYNRKGKIEMAEGGTIFLDEISSISLKIQLELLHFIESKQYTRIGGDAMVNSNVRIITATHERLEELVKEGKFREDLYYKLNIYPINIPPLRERKEDIHILTDFFIKKFSTAMNKPIKIVSKEAMEFLINYEWPGNVRELENAIERAVVVGNTNNIVVEDLPFHVSAMNFIDDDGCKSLSAIEKKHILNILNENHWNISKSASILEIDRVTLYNKISKYGLRKEFY